jgi:hypothetical protein
MRSLHAFGLCVIALAFTLPAALPAQAAGNDAYWVDKDGNILKSGNTGVCFRPDCRERLRKEKMASQK